jgi:hypothetical protein
MLQWLLLERHADVGKKNIYELNDKEIYCGKLNTSIKMI